MRSRSRVVARQADPAKRADPAAEQRSDVAGGEDVDRRAPRPRRRPRRGGGCCCRSRIRPRPVRAARASPARGVPASRSASASSLPGSPSRSAAASCMPSADRQVAAAQVVRGGQVGDHVGTTPRSSRPSSSSARVGTATADRERAPLVAGREGRIERLVESTHMRRRSCRPPDARAALSPSASATRQTPPSIRVIAIGCAEPIPPSPARGDQPSGERAAEVLARHLRRTSHRCPAALPGSRCTASTRRSGRPRRSGCGARARRTSPASPSVRRGCRWPAAPQASAGRLAGPRSACRTGRPASGRRRARSARRRSHRGSAGREPPWRARRRRPGARDPRRSPGCSRAGAGSPPGASRGSAGDRAGSDTDRLARRLARGRGGDEPAVAGTRERRCRRPRPAPRGRTPRSRGRAAAAPHTGSSRRR